MKTLLAEGVGSKKGRVDDQLLLHTYLLAKGMTSAEVPVNEDKDDPKDWEEQVMQLCQAAKIDDYGASMFVRCWRARGKPAGSGGVNASLTTFSIADAALAAMEKEGKVTMAQQVALTKAIADGERAKGKAQFTALVVIWRIYFGMAPSADCESWYCDAHGKLSDPDSMLDGIQPIDVRNCPSKLVRHHCASTKPTLERVLKSGGQDMVDYFDGVVADLTAAGYGQAAQRFRQIVDAPVTQLNMGPMRVRDYLARVFFKYWLGRGLVSVVCQECVNFFACMPEKAATRSTAPPAITLQPSAVVQVPGTMLEAQPAGAVDVLGMLVAAMGGGPASGGVSLTQNSSERIQEIEKEERNYGFCKFCKLAHGKPDKCGAEREPEAVQGRQRRARGSSGGQGRHTAAAAKQASPYM